MLSFHAMAYDFSYNYQGNTLYYNITSDNTIEVTYYSSTTDNNYVSGDVVIPSSVTHNGTTYSVTSIGASAFSCCSSLTSVTIPNSVTSIGGMAFYECSGLTSVTIPNSVTSIGEAAFIRCSGLTSVTLPNNATIHSRAFIRAGEKPTIDGVIYCNDTLIVGNYTFIGTGFLTFYLNENSYFPNNNAVVFDCYSSKSGDLIIPSTISYNGTTYSVISIGDMAFYNCSGLTSVTIPNSVTSIGESAFSSCSSLTSVTIPNSVTSIADYAFAWCSSLTSIVSNAVVPPALGNEVFPYPNSCNVTVPCGSLEAYTSSQWNNYFPNRIEEDCSSALQEVESTREFVVYPNPVRGFAIVEFEALQERSLLRIADLGGRIIKTFDLAAGTESVRLDLRDLPSGVYTLMIGNTTKKLIVE